jgi:hypothetical protein
MATRRSELQTRSHTSREVWHPSSDISAGVRSTWGFHAPAPSVHGFSQPSDGLLLRAASLSYFVQAPLMGFKEQEQIHRGTWCVLGRPAPKSDSTLGAPRVDNSSDRGHSSSMSLVCGGVWNINRVCLLATLPTCHSPTPMRTKALGGGPVGGPSENLLDYHDAPCVVARGQHTPSSEPAMQKRLTSLWSVDFFCALSSSRLSASPQRASRRIRTGHVSTTRPARSLLRRLA